MVGSQVYNRVAVVAMRSCLFLVECATRKTREGGSKNKD